MKYLKGVDAADSSIVQPSYSRSIRLGFLILIGQVMCFLPDTFDRPPVHKAPLDDADGYIVEVSQDFYFMGC